ncbi:MAG: flagellar biosynthetic protein FliO [Methylophaga sp.]|nr:flagellar biosynthetic protein FliO [Methylophaga sp.]
MISQLLKISALFVLFLWSQISIAIEQTTVKTLTTPPVTTGVLLETLLGLILVLAIIVGLAWLLRRTGRFQMSSNGEMKIIASLALGPRERAILIQVGEQQIVIGVTAQQVQTLHVLDKNIETESRSKNTTGFADKLQQVMQQRSPS